jgi:small-conductance mechanosensitive channel
VAFRALTRNGRRFICRIAEAFGTTFMKADLATLFSELRAVLGWAPDWLTSTILIALAALAAVVAHATILNIIRRTATRFSFLRTLVERVRGPLLLALFIFATTAALQAAPLARELRGALTHGLAIGFVLLVGWMVLVALQIAADLYLARFRLDSEDDQLARKHITQIRVLERAAQVLVFTITAASVLMTFEPVRQYGMSILASAGIAGIIAGLAARPVFSNLFAGIQLAVAQPIRIDDAVMVEGQFGRIEEITATYVVVRLWDQRRLVVPLSYFIERPFENWTRESAALLAPVMLYLEYAAPIEAIRDKLDEILAETKLWDGKVKSVQVTDAKPDTMEVRVLLSARNARDAFDLRCEVREKLIRFLRDEHPYALRGVAAAVARSGCSFSSSAGEKS